MTTPLEAAAWVRKQLLDDAARWTDRFVLAMRLEGITDETAARVVNRMLLGVPDPDEVIKPVDLSASLPLFDRSTDHDPFCARCQAGTPCP